MPVILLSDNGSKQAAATLELRKLSEKLSALTNSIVYPVSLQHADSISADKIDGNPAVIFIEFMKLKLLQGERRFILLPLFFGNSRALTVFGKEAYAR